MKHFDMTRLPPAMPLEEIEDDIAGRRLPLVSERDGVDQARTENAEADDSVYDLCYDLLPHVLDVDFVSGQQGGQQEDHQRRNQESDSGSSFADPEKLRGLIVERLTEAEACPDGGHRYFLLGVVRGLLWALNGFDPSPNTLRLTNRILNAAEIPYTWNGEEIIIPNEWLINHNMKPSLSQDQ